MKLPLIVVAAAAFAASALAYSDAPNGGLNQAPQGHKPNPKNSVPSQVKGSSAKPTATPSTGGSHIPMVGPNDNCASATAISGGGPFSFDNTGANTDGPAACGNFQADVWYNWTAGASGTFVVDLCSGGAGFDTEVAVYDTNACVGAQLACNDDFCGLVSHTTFTATSGNVYKIRIGGYSGASGTGTFTVQQPPPPPANNACATPTVISGNGPFPWSNLSATTDGGTESCGTPNQDVWYTWVAPLTSNYALELCSGTSASVDTVVAVYTGAGCPTPGTAIACDDDFCNFAGPSRAVFAATAGATYTIRIGGYAATEGSGTFTLNPPPPPPPNDDCATPVAISGAGPFNFDNTAATTGSQGQSNAVCNAYATTGIDNDLWYTWPAPSSGMATVSLCGQTGMDSKVAVYVGTGCPANPAIACNDDSCSSLQSSVCFPVTSGQNYTIQLGNYPTAVGSTGTFTITVGAPLPPCQYDDGTSENLLGWTAGGDMVWVQMFGSAGSGSTGVSNIQAAFGSAMFPGYSPPNGTAVRVALWDDPNDDGDPSDGVLLQVVNTTVQNVDTDILNSIPIPSTSVNGVFFVGVSESHAAGQYVAVMDQSSCIASGKAWFFGNNNANPADLVNISNNAQLPLSFDNAGYPSNLLLRAGCNVSPLSSFCLPGQGGVHACPCSNPPAGNGLGCNNFGAGPADSATLSASGNASLSADTLVFTSTGENNTSFTIFAQGTTVLSSGVVFGAGVRCVAGTLKRLYSGNAVGGTIVRPGGSDPSVHVRSAALGYTITAGTTLYYFAYYRDPSASGPCGSSLATFNSTQAGSVLWGN